MVWQGWTRLDNTVGQQDTFFHVDDFSGLGGGDFGRLHPLEGVRSMWCGVRPDPNDCYAASWQSPPGYGNLWNQKLTSDPLPFVGILEFLYKGRFDSERDWDYTYVEYDAGNFDWRTIAAYDGIVDTTAAHTLMLSTASTKLRFNFISDGAWSDEDGLWNTDGAAIVDSITVKDSNGIIDFENFESVQTGARHAGIWQAGLQEGYGLYSGLDYALMEDKDPCGSNFGSQIVFFLESDEVSSSYPGLFNTPFCRGPGGVKAPCQNECVISPVIDMTRYSTNCDTLQDATISPGVLSTLGGSLLRFTVYRDLPIQNCVFYLWQVRNIDENGCPLKWLDRGYVYYGAEQDYIRSINPIGDLVQKARIQLSLGCIDMCSFWYELYCNCAEHTPAPWFDNIRIERYQTAGPQWSYREIDLFQDTFPEDALDIEGYCRSDMANDLNPYYNPSIRPGDSIVVSCTSPTGEGIRENAAGPEIYMHVRAEYIGPGSAPWGPKPEHLFGPSLEGDYGRYVSDDGAAWTVMQAETARTSPGYLHPDTYMFDLNDSLFTRGYMISYYFEAYDNGGSRSFLPPDAELRAQMIFRGNDTEYKQVSHIFEFTCLPTGSSDILYVDDFDGIGTFWGRSEEYYDMTFIHTLPPENLPDRYDVKDPSALASNGPGSRAKISQLILYDNIIWDSGNLESGTITAGKPGSDKSDDAQMLIDWMNVHDSDGGLLVCGDDIAEDLAFTGTSQAYEFMHAWCGVTFVDPNYFKLTGGREGGGNPMPLITGADGGIFSIPQIDTFILAGGCPGVNRFDVIEKRSNSECALAYPDFWDQEYYAGIQATDTNTAGRNRRTLWFGFSFMYILDYELASPISRNTIFDKAASWLWSGMGNPDITGSGTAPPACDLFQNYPNPFNPSTEIRFTVRERKHVTLRIYDVSGRLVRTLVDRVKDTGIHSVNWNGRNELGAAVASGVYFYRLDMGQFKRTRKMVLLR